MADRSKLWYLKNINLFHGMSEDQMRMLEQRTVMREVRRREVLYLPGDAGDRIYPPQRLAATLLDLAREHGIQDAQGVLVPLRLSQQDLANLIGVTRESVNLARSDFRRRGLVVLEGRSFRLPRPQGLEELR